MNLYMKSSHNNRNRKVFRAIARDMSLQAKNYTDDNNIILIHFVYSNAVFEVSAFYTYGVSFNTCTVSNSRLADPTWKGKWWFPDRTTTLNLRNFGGFFFSPNFLGRGVAPLKLNVVKLMKKFAKWNRPVSKFQNVAYLHSTSNWATTPTINYGNENKLKRTFRKFYT